MLTIQEVEGQLEEKLRDAMGRFMEGKLHNTAVYALLKSCLPQELNQLAELLISDNTLAKIPGDYVDLPKMDAFETIRFNLHKHLKDQVYKITHKLTLEYAETKKALEEEGISLQEIFRTGTWDVVSTEATCVLNPTPFAHQYEAWMWAEANYQGEKHG